MTAGSNDLDLLLSLKGGKVPETPPGSPSSSHPHFHGYLSDDGSPRRPRASDMSVFREAVREYLNSEPTVPKVLHSKKNSVGKTGKVEIERFSGIKIRNPLVSSVELSNRFSDVRFVRMSAIRNLLSGDTLSGCWATLGVLTEKGEAKVSSAGKNYCIWKMGCLDETNTSVFLFGDAYKMNCTERVGTVFALFNSNVRKDDAGQGHSLSLYSVSQILKIGTSADYGVCKGKRKDGMTCTMVINKNNLILPMDKLLVDKALDQYLHPSPGTKSKVKGGLLLYVVVSKGAPILELLADKDQPLPIRMGALLVLAFGLHVINGV